MKRLGYLIAVMLCVACASSGDATSTTAAAATTAAPAATTSPGASTTGAASAGEVMVSANDFSFSPATVTVSVGDSVTWTLAEGAHTTSSGTAPDLDGLWDQALTADEPFTFTFEEAGTYEYFCRFHPDFMTGTVTVEP